MSTGSQITFTSDFFKPLPGEEEQTNSGCYGQALATWLADRLRKRGVSVEGIIPEDYGWVVMISRTPFLLWLACSNTDGRTTEWTACPSRICRCSSASLTLLTLRLRSND